MSIILISDIEILTTFKVNKNQKNADYKNSITIIIIILWTRCSIRKNINEKLKIIKILFEKNKFNF